jgi:hypothetical protein
MQRRLLGLVLAGLLLSSTGAALADPPVPEANFAANVVSRPCTAEAGNPYEIAQFQTEGWSGPDYARYPGACTRLHFTFGPIVVKPGQNDSLIQPVTIEKPAYDGYITRFRPDLVRVDGTVPPIEEIHLHHGTWFNGGQFGGGGQLGPLDFRNYGSGPFFASGEEKTIADFPRGYGMPINGSDTWLLLYMVHSQMSQPDVVYITYDVDYIAKDAAATIGIKPVYPIWMDVRPSNYPVFNVQREFADANGTCTWPAQKCARFDPWGDAVVGQGLDGNGVGTDWTFPADGRRLGRISAFHGGTLIGIGGHVHPGGLSTSIELVRDEVAKPIFTSEATYWDWDDPELTGGPPNSWDLSMSVTGLPRWGVQVKPGDALRINATYDATIQSTYENMGIAVALLSPDPDTAGLDPFDPDVTVDARPIGEAACNLGPEPKVLCLKGTVTHGHMAEADNKGFADPDITFGNMSSHTDLISMLGFTYLPGDLGMAGRTGIPTVSADKALTFLNQDAALDIWHTVTSCAWPCNGATGIAFPLSNGTSNLGKPIDFDSGELGIGIPGLTAVKNEITWELPINTENGFESGSAYSYFCRIHPFMRGVFAVE